MTNQELLSRRTDRLVEMWVDTVNGGCYARLESGQVLFFVVADNAWRFLLAGNLAPVQTTLKESK